MRLSLTFLWSLLLWQVSGTFVGLDVGHASIRASLVQSGKSPLMLVNAQSKRTTPTALMLQSPPRLVGSPAVSMGVKYPFELIELAHGLAGVECVNDDLPWPREYYPYELKCDEPTNRYRIFVRDGRMKLWPEEILAHYLDYIRELASGTIREHSSSDSVANAAIKKMEFKLTMPVDATYRQHVAYSNAAKIAGVKMVETVDSHIAAAAAFHSTDVRLDEGESLTKLIVDVGALNTQACLVSYQRPKASGAIKSGVRTFVEECHSVKGGAGGLFADWAITRFIMDEFETKFGKIKGQKRDKAIRRVMSEANKKKHVLSANKTTKIFIENLNGDGKHADVSLSRSDLESMLEREGIYSKMIDLINHFSNLEGVEVVEWIGNGWRIPSIQERLSHAFPNLTFQTTINQDESPALGALYLAAQDQRYKSPKVYIEDKANANITMNISPRHLREGKESLENIRKEDQNRRALEQARNDFEEFIYKSHELLTDEKRLQPILEEEASTTDEPTEGGGGWFSSILGGSDPATEESPDEALEGSKDANQEPETKNSQKGMTIAQRIPATLTLVEQAKAWLETTEGEVFDKSRGLKFRDDIRELIQPLMDRLKERKAKLAAERKARLEEKKAQQQADKEISEAAMEETNPEPSPETPNPEEL